MRGEYRRCAQPGSGGTELCGGHWPGFPIARRLTGVRVRDHLEGDEAEVRARVVVNASGPWFNGVAPAIGDGNTRIRTTKGVHLACPPVTRRALVLFSNIDQRLFFVIPLLGLGWISTTDTDFSGDPGSVSADRSDIEYLVKSSADFIPRIEAEPIYWTNAGVRALVMQGGRESDVSRSHRIDSTPGLVSILGGKITGYRAIAEEAVDSVIKQLGGKARCGTAERMLPGSKRQDDAGDLRNCGYPRSSGRTVRLRHRFHAAALHPWFPGGPGTRRGSGDCAVDGGYSRLDCRTRRQRVDRVSAVGFADAPTAVLKPLY